MKTVQYEPHNMCVNKLAALRSNMPQRDKLPVLSLLRQSRAGYYKACALLKSVNYQFSVNYGEIVPCSKNSLIWFFRPCPLSSARSGGSVQREREGSQVNETYIFEILIQNAVDWWVLDPSNPKKIFGPIFSSFLSSCYCEGLSRITSWRFTYPEVPILVWPLKLKLRVSSTRWWVYNWCRKWP